jgi:hypothetical protein
MIPAHTPPPPSRAVQEAAKRLIERRESTDPKKTPSDTEPALVKPDDREKVEDRLLAEPPAKDSRETSMSHEKIDPEKVKAIVRETRACAIANQQSVANLMGETLPKGTRTTSKFKTRGQS